MGTIRTACLVVGALTLGGCPGDSTGPSESQHCGFSFPCPAPQVCHPVQKVCFVADARVPLDEAGMPIDGSLPAPRDGSGNGDGPSVSPDSGAPQPDGGSVSCGVGKKLCGSSCVDTRIHLQHCGDCNHSCGPTSNAHSTCNQGTCECYQPYFNCDGDWSNGCECATSCDGNQCAVWQCDPQVAGDCKDTSHYCRQTDRTCQLCQPLWDNCDQLGGCECKVTSYSCIADKCQ